MRRAHFGAQQAQHIFTHDELLGAMEEYEARGGAVRNLPKEVVPRGTLVGERHGSFEHLRAYTYMRQDG